ncbi:MAG TPA: hypothetical protein VF765_25710 [Polyangiaceae bacterium]
MHAELLAKSPLLMLPLAAMLVFLAVWIGTTLHALTRPRAQMDAAARMPLRDGEGDDHERR